MHIFGVSANLRLVKQVSNIIVFHNSFVKLFQWYVTTFFYTLMSVHTSVDYNNIYSNPLFHRFHNYGRVFDIVLAITLCVRPQFRFKITERASSMYF